MEEVQRDFFDYIDMWIKIYGQGEMNEKTFI